MASYFISHAPPPGAAKKAAAKSEKPVKYRKKYTLAHVIQDLFKDRLKARTQEIAARKGLPYVMSAYKDALKEITTELSPAEVLLVGKRRDAWNSGEITSEREQCM